LLQIRQQTIQISDINYLISSTMSFIGPLMSTSLVVQVIIQNDLYIQ